MKKKLLVPTDFSFCANKALDYAVSLAKKADAEIVLLHALELIHTPFVDQKTLIEQHNQALQRERSQQLQTIKKSIEKTEKVKVITKLYDGDIIASIAVVAAEKDVVLIVMGTVGLTGLQKKIFGSRTAAVMSSINKPVITVPYQYEWSEPKKILLTLNNPKEEVGLLKPAFVVADFFQADLTAAIFTESKKNSVKLMEHSRNILAIQQTLSKAYKKASVKTEHLSGKDFLDTIQAYITDNEINLLVMITHKRKTIEKLFNKSITRKMGYHTTVPLMSIHAKEKGY